MHQPRNVYRTATLRILAYVKGSLRKGLLYKKHGYVRIYGYSDSDYVGDKSDRKSTTGYCTFVGGNLVSKKHDVVSQSSAETEYKAMTHTACEIMWTKNLMLELDFRQPRPMLIVIISLQFILPKILCFMRGLI